MRMEKSTGGHRLRLPPEGLSGREPVDCEMKDAQCPGVLQIPFSDSMIFV